MNKHKSTSGQLCMIVALQAEADPLIRHFELEELDFSPPFRWFQRASYSLVISGVGKYQSACAVGFAYAQLGYPRQCAWLNIGIAGHTNAGRASIFHAVKITDGRTFSRYPICNFSTTTAPETVLTVDQPEQDFAQVCAYDMEAVGFVAAASRLSTVEMVHSLKVISDGPTIATTPMRSEYIKELIHGHCDTIAGWSQKLLQLSCEEQARIQPPSGRDRFYERWHFTVTQKRQIEHQLRRWEARFKYRSPFDETQACQNAGAVIEELEHQLTPEWSNS